MPEGLRLVDIGYWIRIGNRPQSLFVASVAFDAGPVQDAAKMGALFSFAAAILSIIAGKITKVKRIKA